MFIAAKNKQKANLNKVEYLDSDKEDLFIHKQKKEELKEQDIELAIEKQKQKREMSKKFNVFMILWLRQIVVYNTYFVFHLKLTDSYMDSILDIRPSIVKATSIKYALVSLLNPRMRSAKQLRNINSMRRILDNNLTYFFENFLSWKERALACRDLNNLIINHMKINQLKYLNLQPFFESNKEFKKFYSFMDLDYYIENVWDHEFTLMKHSNKDYSKQTIRRISEVYGKGIEVYRKSGDEISHFCFDNCDNDILAFALNDNGIRELKLYHSLLYRDRVENGFRINDKEFESWNDCLHRYDKYLTSNDHKSQHKWISGALGSLYYEKTVNFMKKKKENRISSFSSKDSNQKLMLIDIEAKPPQMWNGVESIEFLKIDSIRNDSNHLDYSTWIAAHPKLPLYVTGNKKGKISVWLFNSLADATVGSEYFTHEKVNILSRNLKLTKLMFSNYGDKLAALSVGGAIYMFNFNMYPENIFPFYKQK